MSDVTDTPTDSTKPVKPAYNEPITLTLRKPVKHGELMVTEITIRPIKAKFMRTLDRSASPLEQTFSMANKITGQTTQVLDEIEGDDLRDLLKHVNGFLFAIRGTGQT